MNFTGRLSLPQRVRHTGLALALAALYACGGGSGAGAPTPSNPEASVRSFLDAVRTNDMMALRQLWGSERGPAPTYLKSEEVDQRLTVIRTYLAHESFEFDQPNTLDPGNTMQRIVKVRLKRKGCEPVVPFTTVPWKNGWLVKDISLADAGNPARACTPESAPPPAPASTPAPTPGT